MSRLPRFAFLVHPLSGLHRRVIGVRRGYLPMALGGDGLAAPAGVICTPGIPGVVEGEVVSVPLVPDQMIGDQVVALDAMKRAVEALDVDAVGLGSLCAVVAGRGEGLVDALGEAAPPITTGAAATAWAAAENALAVLRERGDRRAALIGVGGAVGGAVARRLLAADIEVLAVCKGRAQVRKAERLGARGVELQEALAETRLLVGASTNGGLVAPGDLAEHTVVVDVALPATLGPGTAPHGVTVLAGEAVTLPNGWVRGFWGWLYHALAGYGPWQLYACVVEPLVMAVTRRRAPFALGRSVDDDDLETFAAAAAELGIRPRLARGWRAIPVTRLGGPDVQQALPGPSR